MLLQVIVFKNSFIFFTQQVNNLKNYLYLEWYSDKRDG